MTEKPSTIVDEVRYFKENIEYLKNQLAHFGKYTAGNLEDEARVKRIANIDLAIIYLMNEDAFYNGKFHFFDRKTIIKQFRKFRPDLNATDEEIIDSIQRNENRQRLVVRDFVNDNYTTVTKWVYNANYRQKPENSGLQTLPPKFLPPTGDPNPFESDEFRKLKEEIDKL